jgi:hypothetical protein
MDYFGQHIENCVHQVMARLAGGCYKQHNPMGSESTLPAYRSVAPFEIRALGDWPPNLYRAVQYGRSPQGERTFADHSEMRIPNEVVEGSMTPLRCVRCRAPRHRLQVQKAVRALISLQGTLSLSLSLLFTVELGGATMVCRTLGTVVTAAARCD